MVYLKTGQGTREQLPCLVNAWISSSGDCIPRHFFHKQTPCHINDFHSQLTWIRASNIHTNCTPVASKLTSQFVLTSLIWDEASVECWLTGANIVGAFIPLYLHYIVAQYSTTQKTEIVVGFTTDSM